MTIKQLQNGSDIRGVAIDTAQHAISLTDDAIKRIGYGSIKWACQKLNMEPKNLRVAIGHDCRLSANRIKQQLIKGMSILGVQIIDVNEATTPSMFFANQNKDVNCKFSIMITASHLPFEYNGIKFFTATGGLEHDDITDILELAETVSASLLADDKETSIETFDLLTCYAENLKQNIQREINDGDQPLKGRHIIVDAGNGMGGFFATKVLKPLGANIEGSQYLDPDGSFPNHAPNPDNKAAMASIQKAVLDNKADLGIIFDTDVDRSAIVDRSGETFNRNNLIALISRILLEETPGATIVTNSATSEHLQNFIEAHGGKQDRYLTGYRNVINRALSLNEQGIDAVLAIETSGHAALRENQMLDDGAYLIAKLLIADAKLAKQQKTLSDLIKDLKQPLETDEYRFEILNDPIHENGERIIESFKNLVNETKDMVLISNHLEGMRANFSGQYGEGWFLLRLSLHEPLLVWTIESDTNGGIEQIVTQLKPFFDKQTSIRTC